MNKLLTLIVSNGKDSLMKYIEEHSACSHDNFSEDTILKLTECFFKGGPGSGCTGDNCGRKPGTGSSKPNPANEIIRVGDKPVRISEGGATSGGVPHYEEVKPRKEEEIKVDYINAARELQVAENTFNNSRNTENQHALNRARIRVRDLIREARLARAQANRAKPKAKP